MKIGSTDIQTAAPPPADRKTAAVPDKAPEAAPTRAPTEASTQVALSPEATALANLPAESGAEASFDAGKVERISQAIRNGQFTVNAEAIADKLIVNAEELLGRKLS